MLAQVNVLSMKKQEEKNAWRLREQPLRSSIPATSTDIERGVGVSNAWERAPTQVLIY